MSLVNDFVFAGVPAVYLLIGLVIYRYKPTQRFSMGLALVIIGIGYLFFYTTILKLFPIHGNTILVFATLLIIDVLTIVVGVICLARWQIKPKLNLS